MKSALCAESLPGCAAHAIRQPRTRTIEGFRCMIAIYIADTAGAESRGSCAAKYLFDNICTTIKKRLPRVPLPCSPTNARSCHRHASFLPVVVRLRARASRVDLRPPRSLRSEPSRDVLLPERGHCDGSELGRPGRWKDSPGHRALRHCARFPAPDLEVRDRGRLAGDEVRGVQGNPS